jgi:small subunit ribosomal protein S36
VQRVLVARLDDTVAVRARCRRTLVPEHQRVTGQILQRSETKDLGVEQPVAHDGQVLVVQSDFVVHLATVEERDRNEAIELQLIHEQRRHSIGEELLATESLEELTDSLLPDDLDPGHDAATIGVFIEVLDRGTEEVAGPGIVVVVQDEEVSARGLDPGVGRRPTTQADGMVYDVHPPVIDAGTRDDLIEGEALPTVVDDDQLPVGERLTADTLQRPQKEDGSISCSGDDGYTRGHLGLRRSGDGFNEATGSSRSARHVYDGAVHASEGPRSDATALAVSAPLFRGLPILVWLLCGLMIAAMTLWTFTRATLTAQDERAHVGAALYIHEFHAWPGFQDMQMSLSAMRAAEQVTGPPFTGDEVIPRAERPSIRELTTPDNLVSARTLNQMSQHPPLYYAMLAVLHEGLAPWDLPFDLELWIWRFFSVVILAPLPLLSASLARRLGASRLMVIAAAAAAALLPGLQILGGSVNNDNLLIAASAWAFLGIGCVLTGDTRLRTAVGVGVALAVALLTKAFALPVAAVAAAAYLVVALRRRSLRTVVAPLLVMVAVAALGGWWWVRNVLIYGTPQPSGHGAAVEDGPLGFAEAWPTYIHTFMDRFFTRYWLGANGPIVGAIGVGIAIAATVLYVVAVAVLLVRSRSERVSTLNATFLTVPLFAMGAIVAVQSYRYTAVTGVAAGVQGRYLYPALVGAVAAFALIVTLTLRRGLQRITLAALLALGLAATLWRVLIAVFSSWGTAQSTFLERLDAVYSWSPLPYAASVIVHAAFAIMIVLVVVSGVRELRSAAREDVDHRSERAAVTA